MSFFKREARSLNFAEPPIPPFPGASGFGGSAPAPSIDSAMQVSAVWACVRLLAEAVSMMPLDAFTKRAGVRIPTNTPPLLIQPSADAHISDFVYMVMVSLLLRGNAYGQILRRDSLGFPVQIELIHPDKVIVQIDRANGTVVYSTREGGIIPNLDMWHVRAFRMPGSPVGLSPIKYAAQAINTDSAISSFSLGYFTDAPHPSSVLESDQPINSEQARSIKDRLLASLSGREPLVLGLGLKFSPISVTPEESQFLASQKLGTAGIARYFGVPAEMINAEAGNAMTYTSMEAKGIDFLTYSVQPWLTRLEAAFAPLMPGKQHARFDTSVLTRTDLETKVKAGAIAIASKQQTPDEVRAWSDLPPLTDEQRAWLEIIPLTVSPTGMPKALPPAPAAPATPATTATEETPA